MKIEVDTKLLKIGIYTTLTAIAIYISFSIISNIYGIFKAVTSVIGTFFSLIKPLIIAAAIAYLLHPITKFIERFLEKNKIYSVKNKSNRRVISVFTAYLLIIGIITGLICGIYFMIGGQLSQNTSLINIIEYIKSYTYGSSFDKNSIERTLKDLHNPIIDMLDPYIIKGLSYLEDYLVSNIGSLSTHVMSWGSNIASFFIALIISIYLLKDSEYFIGLFKKLYYLIFRKSKTGTYIIRVFSIIHDVFFKFIRGQLLEAFIVAVLSTIALMIAGIDYAPVIGLISGICNMIPYVGPIAGTILAGTMALLSGSYIKIIYAVVAMIVVQQLDNHLLAPKIVGDSVGLHAVFTMLAIIVGGSTGGFLGMLLAVPLTASFKVLFNLWYDKKIKET